MSMSSKKVTARSISLATSLATMLVVLLAGAQANAATASQCKGLENSACASDNACSWVESYERKDGIKVNAFCRTKAKPKSTTSAPSKLDNKASS